MIDQPEDDLDNTVIFELAAEVWSANYRRQLIFSSHNANLVVHGDAELVVCCEYPKAGDHGGGRVACEEAIDLEVVRRAITSVMEGGEDAFTLRRHNYGF